MNWCTVCHAPVGILYRTFYCFNCGTQQPLPEKTDDLPDTEKGFSFREHEENPELFHETAKSDEWNFCCFCRKKLK